MEIQRPKIGVAAIVVRDGKILMGKRLNAHGDGTWSFPGGHLEMWESWAECAARETMEEAGVEVRNLRFAGVTNDLFRDEGKHYNTIFIICEWESGEPRICEPEKCGGWQWVLWHEMPQPCFSPINELKKQGFKPC